MLLYWYKHIIDQALIDDLALFSLYLTPISYNFIHKYIKPYTILVNFMILASKYINIYVYIYLKKGVNMELHLE